MLSFRAAPTLGTGHGEGVQDGLPTADLARLYWRHTRHVVNATCADVSSRSNIGALETRDSPVSYSTGVNLPRARCRLRMHLIAGPDTPNRVPLKGCSYGCQAANSGFESLMPHARRAPDSGNTDRGLSSLWMRTKSGIATTSHLGRRSNVRPPPSNVGFRGSRRFRHVGTREGTQVPLEPVVAGSARLRSTFGSGLGERDDRRTGVNASTTTR